MGIESILNIARNAMSAAQTSVQVTSHNVANVNTDGYSRQEAVLQEATPVPTGAGLLGTGVFVKSVRRFADNLLDSAIAERNSALQQQQTTRKYFERVQAILQDDNSNLSQNIIKFFNGWQELSTDPTSTSVRTAIVSYGQGLSNTIKNLYSQLRNVQNELDGSLGQEVEDINRSLASIADLNNRISVGAATGVEAGDLVDQRNQLLRELSGKLDVRTLEDKYGRFTVLTSSGSVLVDGDQHWNLKTIEDSTTGLKRVAWEGLSGNLTDLTDQLGAGSLRAIIDMRDQYIGDGFLKQVDELAKSIITAVNGIHKGGSTLNGTTNVPFFKEITANYAENMRVSDEVKADVRNIATTSSASNPTDNDVALQIAALGDSELSIDGSMSTLSDYVASVIGNVGGLTRNAMDLEQFQQGTMAAMENQRANLSGVSIDEEMANLIKFQYAYQAAARLFTTADELLQTLLGMMK